MKYVGIFIGSKDPKLSRGFKNGEKYTFNLSSTEGAITVTSKDNLSCIYGSVISFLDNWSEVKKL